MEIVGNGFLAGHLKELLGDRHPDATAIAAGVSNVYTTSINEFDREAEMVFDVVRRCREHGRRVIFFSTASAGMYGAPDSPGTEDGPVFPLTAYGRHKLGLEHVLAHSETGWLTLRLSHVVGDQQQKHQLLPSLRDQVRSGAVTVFRGASRDLIDVHHVAGVLDLLLERGVTTRILNVASGVSEPVERIIGMLERRLGVDTVRRTVDEPTRSAHVEIARLREIVPEVEDFGFGPEYLTRLIDRYVAPGEPCWDA